MKISFKTYARILQTISIMVRLNIKVDRFYKLIAYISNLKGEKL